MSGTRCADPLCGHTLTEHDDEGCVGAVCTDEGIPNGPNAEPPVYDRCWCPKFHETFQEPTP